MVSNIIGIVVITCCFVLMIKFPTIIVLLVIIPLIYYLILKLYARVILPPFASPDTRKAYKDKIINTIVSLSIVSILIALLIWR